MSAERQTFDVSIKVVDINDQVHEMNNAIAIELVSDPRARVEIVNYLVDLSKRAIVNKIGESL